MIELIAGGARSGKSRYALSTANNKCGNKIFVATATADDAEMAARIAKHKAERGPGWKTIECTKKLSQIVGQYGRGDILLVDCLTLWLSNWLCSDQIGQWEVEKSEFLHALKNSEADILLVTNEVGMGVVPTGRLSRDFVDQSGWMHQEIASLADKVTLVMFGLKVSLK